MYAGIAAIEAHGISDEGLFRVPGNTAVVEALKAQFELGKDPLKAWSQAKALKDVVDVSDIASCLKLFFRSLDLPVIPFDLHSEFVAATKTTDETKGISIAAELLKKMPLSHIAVLEHLLPFLERVSAQAETNKMHTKNLAMVFGPTLLPAAPTSSVDLNKLMMDTKGPIFVVEFLIKHHREVLPPPPPPPHATSHKVSDAGVTAVESILGMLPADDPQRAGVERTLEALRSSAGNSGSSGGGSSNSSGNAAEGEAVEEGSGGGDANGSDGAAGAAGAAGTLRRAENIGGARPKTVWIEPPPGRTPGTPGRQRKALPEPVQRRVIPGTPSRARRATLTNSGIDWV